MTKRIKLTIRYKFTQQPTITSTSAESTSAAISNSNQNISEDIWIWIVVIIVTVFVCCIGIIMLFVIKNSKLPEKSDDAKPTYSRIATAPEPDLKCETQKTVETLSLIAWENSDMH